MIAILVAAGSSRRMGFDKLTADLAGKPVVAWSLLAFECAPSVRRILLVTREDRVEEFTALARAHGISKLAGVVPGGGERHLSVWNGLQAAEAAPDEFVAVHDAARPLISPAAIEGCLALAREHGAAACAAPIVDTLKRATADGFVSESVERENLWAMQTPQLFLARLLEEAYRSLLRTNTIVTDEVSALQRLGLSVALYRNREANLKITLPEDIPLARLVLNARLNA